jgi:chromosome segregation ATPase
MNTHIDKLRAKVAELEHELNKSNTLDAEMRRELEETVQEIRSALDESGPSEAQRRSLDKRLKESVIKFEARHPALILILGHLIDTLAMMGI